MKQLAFATAHLQALDFVVRRGKEGRVGGTNKQKKERRRKGFGAKSLIESVHTCIILSLFIFLPLKLHGGGEVALLYTSE